MQGARPRETQFAERMQQEQHADKQFFWVSVTSQYTLWLLAGAAAIICYAAILQYHWWRWRRQLASEGPIAIRNQAIVEGSGEGVLEIGPGGQVIFANPAAQRMLGYEHDELIGCDYRRLLAAPNYPGGGDMTRIGYTTDMLRGIGAVLRCKGGRNRPIEYRMLPLRQGSRNGSTAELYATSLLVFRDLTERTRIDVMLADMQYLAQVGAWELKIGSARLVVSEGISRQLQLSAGRGVHAKHLLLGFTAESRHQLFLAMRAAVDRGQNFDLELQLRAATPRAQSGSEWLRVMGRAERLDGATVRLYGAIQDVTDRKQAEVLLRQTSNFFKATLDALPASVMYLNQFEQIEYCNASPLARWLELEQASGHLLSAVIKGAHYPNLAAGVRQALQGHAGHILRAFDNDEKHLQIQCNFVPHAASEDRHAGCWLVLSDVTEMKMLEARLYQAEKLQAVGQLTGGVAHDFNNLLGVILGNLQLLERDVRADESISRKLATAMRAAIRGSDLTKRLLSFARRQTLEPQVIEPSVQLKSFAELLQQTLGDAVQIRFQLDPVPWRIKVDVGQFENAILNLALNARDAMSHGGVLTLATRNVHPDANFFSAHPDLEPGDYVEICVADTGNGIPPQVLNRIFEPFFTTKEIGKGSGLGLAMVHGFVKQSAGTVIARSELWKGTEICLFLPRSTANPPVKTTAELRGGVRGGDEVILVVEDDTDLRATTVLGLQQLGYQVLEASNGEVALAVLRQHERIDLLFTDVIMPAGMLGTELAWRARALKPNIQVLLTTGYLGDPLLSQAGTLSNEVLLPKPYVSQELAQKIRALLD